MNGKLLTLEKVVESVYTLITKPEGISVFSSNTMNSLSETIDSFENNEMNIDNSTNKKGLYKMTFTAVLINDMYRSYINYIHNQRDLSLNQKVFYIYLYPIYLESLVNAGFSEFATDGVEKFSDRVHSTLSIGNNQIANMFALRNNKETLEEQNAFIIEEVERAVRLSADFIYQLEDFNFFKLKGEFIGWMDNFPTRLFNYISSLYNYNKVADTIEYENIESSTINNLISIISELSIFTILLQRVANEVQ